MLSPSTKSASGSARPPSKWRLKRTLKRAIDYRPIEDEDVKYAWAAYKQGGLAALNFATDLSPDDFKALFEQTIVSKCHAAWTLFGNTKRGFIPVGIVLAAWAPSAPYLIVLDIDWMPWASHRNIIECSVGFFNGARKDFAFVGYALPEHKRMYEVCAMHGVMRRVGTSYVAIPGHHCAVFETRPI
jgi:hypothetical protein